MKKLFFFLAILIAVSFQATSTSAQSEWSSWRTATCHSKIQFRVRQPADRSVNEKFGYQWYIQFKNTSSKSVAFSYTMKGSTQENIDYIKLNGGQGRVNMAPNSTDDGLSWQFVKNPSEVFVVVGYFHSLEPGQTGASVPFEGCDNTKTTVDDLCFYKPTSSCPNDGKDKDKKAEANANGSGLSTDEVKQKIVENLKSNLFQGQEGKSTIKLISVSIENESLRIITSRSYPSDSTISYQNATTVNTFLGLFKDLNPNIKFKVNANLSSLLLQGTESLQIKQVGVQDTNISRGFGQLGYNVGKDNSNFTELVGLIKQLNSVSGKE